MLCAEDTNLNRNQKLAILASLICLPLTSCTRVSAKSATEATDAVPVHVVLAQKRDVPLEVSAVGSVEAIESVEVKSHIPGQIRSVAFQEGQNVTKGQLLFTIDRDGLERQAAEQQAEIERDAAMEQQARAVVTRDEAAQKQSESEAVVARKLGDLGVLSGQRVNELVTTSDTANAGLHSDLAAVAAAAGATKADRARLAQTQLQLDFSNIVAPISGRAGVAMAKAGNMVRDNDTTLVSILQLAPIYVTFGIPEQSLAEVRRLNALGPLAVEATSGSGAPIVGRLAVIDNAVDATTGTIRLKASFSNGDSALWPGEFVHVRLRLRTEQGRIVVPQSAVQEGLDGKYVWLVQSGAAVTRPVKELRTYKTEDGPEEAVLEEAGFDTGVESGETVVTEGQLRLIPGARVALLNSPSPDTANQPSAAR